MSTAEPKTKAAAAAARDEPAVDGEGDDAGDGQREGERAPEQDVADAGLHRPGDGEHQRVVDDLHYGDAEGVGGERDRHDGGEREARAQQREAGQRVAEQEGQPHGEGDGAPLGEAERGPDDHAQDLADRAAREAVQRRAQRAPRLLPDRPRSRLAGVAVATLAIALTTLVISPLREVAPAVSTGVLYLLAVLLVSTLWGTWLGLATAVASALAWGFFHLPPTGRFTIADPENLVALGVFLATAVVASTVADLVRATAAEAVRRREEADLAAELARVLLGEASVEEALPVASSRLAAALGLSYAAIELEGPQPSDRHAALPLQLGHGRSAVLQVPDDLPQSTMARLRDRVPLVQADAAQLERVLANLIENAQRFSGGHPVKLRARVSGGRLLIRVIDRGPGIPAEMLPHVFEPFRRGAVDGGHRGSGLGLAIVKGFVEANGGRVWAESLPRQGTVFVVELPLSPQPAARA